MPTRSVIRSAENGARLAATSADRIKEARERRGLPLEIAASTLGIPAKRWKSLECGAAEPTLHEGLQLAVLFGVSPEWIAGQED
ncbi:MAG: helix-turn-helix domain-containing protein [Acidobacteriales bacterium]|nr:helix-turn-helix domain-containing protein [Terriglobales bacterium]